MTFNSKLTKLLQAKRAPVLFLDFDGTVSTRDAIDLMLERFADEKWIAVEERWKSGSIGSRECLSEQVALIRASRDEIDGLLDEIRLDNGFYELLKHARRHNIKTQIISDGFDYCIERLLSRIKAHQRPSFFSSHLEFQDGKWQTDFPHSSDLCEHRCATCKPLLMMKLNPKELPTIFVGDGLSDRYAARAADLVFAKNGLAKYCSAEQIDFLPYGDLYDVAHSLSKLMDEMTINAERGIPFSIPAFSEELFN